MEKKAKMTLCSNCKAEMPANAKVCPSCGAKNRKPFYRKWWVILLAVIAVIVVISGMIGNREERFDWNEVILSERLPEPGSNVGEIIANDSEYLSLNVDHLSQRDYEAYVEECQAMGYTVDQEKDGSLFDAFDEEGYHVSVGLPWGSDVDFPASADGVGHAELAEERSRQPASIAGVHRGQSGRRYDRLLHHLCRRDARSNSSMPMRIAVQMQDLPRIMKEGTSIIALMIKMAITFRCPMREIRSSGSNCTKTTRHKPQTIADQLRRMRRHLIQHSVMKQARTLRWSMG